MRKRYRSRYIAFALLSVCLAACFVGFSQVLISAQSTPRTVLLTIDYADGVEKRFTSIPWKKGMTVFDALSHARKHPRGIKLETRGRGATLFVTQIDDLKNQGGNGLNWIFKVNGKLGERSCGLQKLRRKDDVLWKFDRYH